MSQISSMSQAFRLSGLALTMLLAVAMAPATAADKIALVIGNDFYQNAPPLRSAAADARAVRDHLERERGFRVYFAENADVQRMSDAVAGFLGASKEGDVAAVFFFGYGEQASFGVSRGLYLLPVDMPSLENFEAGRDSVIAARATSVDVIRDHLRRRDVGLRFFVFDARPMLAETTAARGLSDAARGLARIDPTRGEIMIHAAQPGQTPIDSLGPGDDNPTSVFTRVFLEQFQPGVPLARVAANVKLGVTGLAMAANKLQEPYIETGEIGVDCLEPICKTGATAPTEGAIAIGPSTTPSAGEPAPSGATALTVAPLGGDGGTATLEQPLIARIAPPGGSTEPAGLIGAQTVVAPLATGAIPAPSPAPAGADASSALAALGDAAAAPASEADNANAMAAYEDAKARGSMTALQLVAQIYPTTVWGRLAALDVEENRIKEQSEAALANIASARATLDWERLKQTRDVRELNQFIRDHGDGPLAEEAAAARDALLADYRAGQVELRRLRFYWGAIDGDWGPGSRGAMEAFQSEIGETADGRLTKASLARLLEAPTPPPSVRSEPPAAAAPAPSAALAGTAQPSGSWRYRVEVAAEFEGGFRKSCVRSVVHDSGALRTGREPIDCGAIQGFQLNVSQDGLLLEGSVFADQTIPLRGKRWSFVGAGSAGSDVSDVKIVVRRQVY